MSVAVALAVSLAGCAGASGSSLGSGQAGANAAGSDQRGSGGDAAASTVDTIVVAADSLVLVTDGVEVARLEATDVIGTVGGLRGVLGDPIVTDFPAAECTSPFTRYSWGDAITIDDRADDFLGDYSARFFRGEAVGDPSGRLIPIEGPNGERVGDDIAAYIEARSPELVEGFAEASIVLLARGWDDVEFPAGVAAFTENDIVQNIGMPIGVNSGIDC